MNPFRGRAAFRAPAVLLMLALTVLVVGPQVWEPVSAQDGWPVPPERNVSYRIDAELAPTSEVAVNGEDGEAPSRGFRIIGKQRIEWRNPTESPTSVLYLHLYPNAFRSPHTTLLSERARYGRTLPDDMQFGGLEVLDARFTAGEPLTLEFIRAEDGNEHDSTVARVALPGPIAPGERAVVTLQFVTTLPTLVRRMGHHEGFVMAAQWYPKLGRFVGDGAPSPNLREGWYCHQYHETTEFFADYADYDVTLKLPAALKPGATGHRVGEAVVDSEADTRTFTYRAESVVDFAWTAHARFERHVKMVRPAHPDFTSEPDTKERLRLGALLDLPDEAFDLPSVKVELLLQPEHADQKSRHFDAARRALGFFGTWFGPYPYDKLTIVDPAFGASAAGGMEYPQLVTAGTAIGKPFQSLQPEGVIIHEIGHQWFMNLVASNEAEEAWLDEGFTTYFTGYFMDLAYGPGVRHTRVHGRPILSSPVYKFPGVIDRWPGALGLPEWAQPPRMPLFEAWADLPWLTGVTERRYHGDHALARRPSWLRQAGWDSGVQPGWHFHDRGSYGSNVYSRATLFLHALRRRMQADLGADEGEKAFVLTMRDYASKFRWKHPTTDDFLGIAARRAKTDPVPFADALLRTSGVLDYGVADVRVVSVAPPTELAPETSPEENKTKRSEIVVRRHGPVVQPVVLAVCREKDPGPDSIWERIEWDGVGPWKRFTVDGEVTAAQVDPDGIYLLDVNRSNNSYARALNRRPAAKWGVRTMVWLQNAFLSYGRFF